MLYMLSPLSWSATSFFLPLLYFLEKETSIYDIPSILNRCIHYSIWTWGNILSPMCPERSSALLAHCDTFYALHRRKYLKIFWKYLLLKNSIQTVHNHIFCLALKGTLFNTSVALPIMATYLKLMLFSYIWTPWCTMLPMGPEEHSCFRLMSPVWSLLKWWLSKQLYSGLWMKSVPCLHAADDNKSEYIHYAGFCCLEKGRHLGNKPPNFIAF